MWMAPYHIGSYSFTGVRHPCHTFYLTPLAFNDLDLACVEREKVMKRFLRVHQKPIGNYKALVRFLEDFDSSKNTHKNILGSEEYGILKTLNP